MKGFLSSCGVIFALLWIQGSMGQDDTGALFVHGSLRSSACLLSMNTAWQGVVLSASSTTIDVVLGDCSELSANLETGNSSPLLEQTGLRAVLMRGADDRHVCRLKYQLRDSFGRKVSFHDNKALVPLTLGQSRVQFSARSMGKTICSSSNIASALIILSLDYQ